MTAAHARIMAFDCALTTGWAFVDHDPSLAYQVPDFGHFISRVGATEPRGAIWNRFHAEVTRLVTKYRPTHLVAERPNMRGFAATEIAMGMFVTVQRVAASCPGVRGRLVLPFLSVQPSKLKLWATGKGNATKGAMGLAARRMFPGLPVVVTDDEADALVLAAWALDQVNAQQ